MNLTSHPSANATNAAAASPAETAHVATHSLGASIASLRVNYGLARLSEEHSHSDPFKQFEQWFGEAIEAQVPEFNAMTLATVGINHRPSARIVLIKSFDEHGFVWFTNYQSRKGQELAANPFATLLFHWVALERTVSIEGRVERVDAQTSDEYFESRPLQSQIAAIASPQSTRLASRSALEANVAKASQAYGNHPKRPLHWGGYRLKPDRFEFWQGRANRLHDRLLYERQLEAQSQSELPQAQWSRCRLAP